MLGSKRRTGHPPGALAIGYPAHVRFSGTGAAEPRVRPLALEFPYAFHRTPRDLKRARTIGFKEASNAKETSGFGLSDSCVFDQTSNDYRCCSEACQALCLAFFWKPSTVPVRLRSRHGSLLASLDGQSAASALYGPSNRVWHGIKKSLRQKCPSGASTMTILDSRQETRVGMWDCFRPFQIPLHSSAMIIQHRVSTGYQQVDKHDCTWCWGFCSQWSSRRSLSLARQG